MICLDLDPNHGPALANLAVLLDRLGDTDGALEIADRALNISGHPHLVKIVDNNKAAGGYTLNSNRNATYSREIG